MKIDQLNNLKNRKSVCWNAEWYIRQMEALLYREKKSQFMSMCVLILMIWTLLCACDMRPGFVSPWLVQRSGCCKFKPQLFTAHKASWQRGPLPRQPRPAGPRAAAGGQAPAEDESWSSRLYLSSVPARSLPHVHQRLVRSVTWHTYCNLLTYLLTYQ